MIALVRAEWLKLRTTAVPWVLLGVALVLTGLGILFAFLSGGGNNNGGNGNGPTWITPHTVDQLRNLAGAGITAYLSAMLLGVLCITTEFRHKTVTNAFLVTPRRGRFITAKLITSALAGAVYAIAVLLVSVGVGAFILSLRHGSVSDLIHQIPAVAPGLIAVFVLYALFGTGIGSLLTNQVAALILVLAWVLLIENLIGLFLNNVIEEGLSKWLPGSAAQSLANHTARARDATPLLPWWGGGLVLLAYGLGFALLGWFVMSRRDIT